MYKVNRKKQQAYQSHIIVGTPLLLRGVLGFRNFPKKGRVQNFPIKKVGVGEIVEYH